MSATSNTRECILEHRGKRLIGVLFDQLPMGRSDLAAGTKTLVFDDGTGLTFASNGSFWSETARDVSIAVSRFREQMEQAGILAAEMLELAGAKPA